MMATTNMLNIARRRRRRVQCRSASEVALTDHQIDNADGHRGEHDAVENAHRHSDQSTSTEEKNDENSTGSSDIVKT